MDQDGPGWTTIIIIANFLVAILLPSSYGYAAMPSLRSWHHHVVAADSDSDGVANACFACPLCTIITAKSSIANTRPPNSTSRDYCDTPISVGISALCQQFRNRYDVDYMGNEHPGIWQRIRQR